MTFIDDMVDEYTYNDAYTLYALVTHFSAVALILFSTPTSPYGQVSFFSFPPFSRPNFSLVTHFSAVARILFSTPTSLYGQIPPPPFFPLCQASLSIFTPFSFVTYHAVAALPCHSDMRHSHVT